LAGHGPIRQMLCTKKAGLEQIEPRDQLKHVPILLDGDGSLHVHREVRRAVEIVLTGLHAAK
jgi:mannose-6-phosphate isomerase-like protein (cupin superfamily)